jgi:hypothetical protein
MDTLIGVVVIVVFALVGLMLSPTKRRLRSRMLSRWWLAHRSSGWPPPPA